VRQNAYSLGLPGGGSALARTRAYNTKDRRAGIRGLFYFIADAWMYDDGIARDMTVGAGRYLVTVALPRGVVPAWIFFHAFSTPAVLLLRAAALLEFGCATCALPAARAALLRPCTLSAP